MYERGRDEKRREGEVDVPTSLARTVCVLCGWRETRFVEPRLVGRWWGVFWWLAHEMRFDEPRLWVVVDVLVGDETMRDEVRRTSPLGGSGECPDD